MRQGLRIKLWGKKCTMVSIQHVFALGDAAFARPKIQSQRSNVLSKELEELRNSLPDRKRDQQPFSGCVPGEDE